jgi:hypothetical protein
MKAECRKEAAGISACSSLVGVQKFSTTFPRLPSSSESTRPHLSSISLLIRSPHTPPNPYLHSFIRPSHQPWPPRPTLMPAPSHATTPASSLSPPSSSPSPSARRPPTLASIPSTIRSGVLAQWSPLQRGHAALHAHLTPGLPNNSLSPGTHWPCCHLSHTTCITNIIL